MTGLWEDTVEMAYERKQFGYGQQRQGGVIGKLRSAQWRLAVVDLLQSQFSWFTELGIKGQRKTWLTAQPAPTEWAKRDKCRTCRGLNTKVYLCCILR